MLLYRISKSIYANELRASGQENRWNSNGNMVIYAASSLSLACLEVVVNTSNQLLITQNFSSVIIDIPEETGVTIAGLDTLPEDWKEREQKSYTQQIGDDWYNNQETLLLRVPSAIINTEFNYLMNTKHPDFNKVSIAQVDNFMFDKRIKS